MNLSSTPIKLSFKDLNYKVLVKNEEEKIEQLHVLKEASGYAVPG